MNKLYKSKPFHIGTARFNNITYKENKDWKTKKKWEGCVYGFDKQIPMSVKKGEYIFVIEMNNDENIIMGIGLIKNIYKPSNRTKIYKNETWNKYVFKGKKHISREKLLRIDNGNITIKFLERILFYGYRHFKRGQGCAILSNDRIATCQNIAIKNKEYKCKKCGLPKKGHVCNNKIVKKIRENQKCRICGKTKHGHICEGIKKDFVLVDAICKFFTKLF